MKWLIAVMTLGFVSAAECGTATYRWIDDQGTVNFTEDLGKVPKKYRKDVRMLGEEESQQAPAGEPDRKEQVPPLSDVEKPVAVPQGRDPEKLEYDGKTGSAWRSEFGKLDADIKAAEDQLSELRNQLKETSRMSRIEYLNINATIRKVEERIVMLRNNREKLVESANRALVPEELR